MLMVIVTRFFYYAKLEQLFVKKFTEGARQLLPQLKITVDKGFISLSSLLFRVMI